MNDLDLTLKSHSQNGDFFTLDRRLSEMKNHIQAFSDEFKKLQTQLQEIFNSSHLKVDRLQTAVVRLEQNQQAMAQEFGQKLSQTLMKMNDRRSIDTKVQEMMDRHQQSLKSFESRMNQMQRILVEKENQMAQMQTLLAEAKSEISRLKKF